MHILNALSNSFCFSSFMILLLPFASRRIYTNKTLRTNHEFLRNETWDLEQKFSYISYYTSFIDQIMKSNRQGREDHSRVTLTPDVIMHVLRLQRRQASAFTERRYSAADIDSDEENEWEAYNLEVLDDNASFEEDSTEYASECYIS